MAARQPCRRRSPTAHQPRPGPGRREPGPPPAPYDGAGGAGYRRRRRRCCGADRDACVRRGRRRPKPQRDRRAGRFVVECPPSSSPRAGRRGHRVDEPDPSRAGRGAGGRDVCTSVPGPGNGVRFPEEALVSGVDDLVAAVNDLEVAGPPEACTMDLGPGYRIAFGYDDGPSFVDQRSAVRRPDPRGRQHLSRGSGGRRGGVPRVDGRAAARLTGETTGEPTSPTWPARTWAARRRARTSLGLPRRSSASTTAAAPR